MNRYQHNQSGFQVEISDFYLYYKSGGKACVLRADEAKIGFGRNLKVVYADDEIYVFRNFYSIDFKNVQLLKENHSLTRKFKSKIFKVISLLEFKNLHSGLDIFESKEDLINFTTILNQK